MNPSANRNKKKGLGRGYGALLGENKNTNEVTQSKPVEKKVTDNELQDIDKTDTIKQSEQTTVINKITSNNAQKLGQMIYKVAIEKVSNNKSQPRKKFDKERLKSLSESIKENGIIQPITVRKKNENNYEIVAGERRWRASQMAGLHEVPVIIQSYTEQKTLEIALIENVQRENLNPIEEAFAYKNLMDEFDLTQTEVAEKIGKERTTVANLLRLIKLAPEVREMVKNSEISLGHAKVLLSLDDYRLQFKVARKVLKSSLSVKQTSKLIKRLQGAQVEEKDEINSGIGKQIKSLEQEMQKILGTKVKLNYDKGKSKLQIQFYTVSELNSFVNNLRDNWKN